MDLIEALSAFAGQFGLGMYPLSPKSDTLGSYVPDLSGLPRDPQGIIGQQQDDPNRPPDGGDSAHKTGIAAFCGSANDKALLGLFESDGIMVRHPSQPPWNNWRNCSRDQLIAYTSGCWRASRIDISRRLLNTHAARFPPFTCQNTENDAPGTTKNPPIGDPMGPHDVMALRIASGDDGAYLDLLGQFSLQVAIELSDRNVEVEKNQIILQSILCGRLNLYVQAHPNYKENIQHYWSGWRKQKQIGDAFIHVIEKELERYDGQIALPFLPINIINLLKSIDLTAEVKNLNPARMADLSVKFLEASLKDSANTYIFLLKLGINEAIRKLRAVGATIDQIAKTLGDIGQIPNAIRAGLESVGFPADLIAKAMKVAFPGIPHADVLAIPHADVLAMPHVDVAAVHTDVAGVHSDVAAIHGDVAAVHADAFGVDAIITPHGDAITTPHVNTTTSHGDAILTPHVDTPATAHIDTPATAHVDTP